MLSCFAHIILIGMVLETTWLMTVKLFINKLEIEEAPGLELNGGTGGGINVNGDIIDQSFWNSTLDDISHKLVEDLFWWKVLFSFDGIIRSQIDTTEALLETKILSDLKKAWKAQDYNFAVRDSTKFVFGEIPCYEYIVQVDYSIEYCSMNDKTSQKYKADHHVMTVRRHNKRKRWHFAYKVMLSKIFVILFVMVSSIFVHSLIVNCDQ